MPAEVVVAGHIALDILPDMSSLKPQEVIAAGKVYEIGRISYSTGGAVSNTGLALHQLGVNVSLQAAVGDDWVGRAIIDYVRRFGAGLGDHIQVVPAAASAYTVVIEPQNHDRTLLTHTGVYNDYGPEQYRPRPGRGWSDFPSRLSHASTRLYGNNGAELLSILRAVKDARAITSIDMSLPAPDQPSGRVNWRAILRRCLPYIEFLSRASKRLCSCCAAPIWSVGGKVSSMR